MDSGDKATNKAMSAAFKYACLQAFCIPTEGDNDADATTHVVDTTPAVKVVAPKAAVKKSQDKLVGESEVQTITNLATHAGITLEQICSKHNVPFIELLPLSKAGEVIKRLQELSITTGETA
jgi:hypothetical protein